MLVPEEEEAFLPLSVLDDKGVSQHFTGASSTWEWVLLRRLVPGCRWAVTREYDRLGRSRMASVCKEDRYELVLHLLASEVLGDEGESEVLLVDFDPLLLSVVSSIPVEDEVDVITALRHTAVQDLTLVRELVNRVVPEAEAADLLCGNNLRSLLPDITLALQRPLRQVRSGSRLHEVGARVYDDLLRLFD